MKKTLQEILSVIGGTFAGNGSIEIKGIRTLEEAQQGDLAFLFDIANLKALDSTKASCVVVPNAVDKAPCNIVRSENVQIAFKKASNILGLDRIPGPKGIHSTAYLANTVSLGTNVAIGAYVVIEEGVHISDNTMVYPYAYIGHNTSIGKNCKIFPNVTIREKCIIGNNVTIHPNTVIGADGFGYEFDMSTGSFIKIPQIGKVVIHDDVEIGACVTIDRAKIASTIIGKGTKIDNLTQIAHNVKIGMNTVIAAQTGIAGSTEVGNFVMMGGQVGIRDHVKIGDKVKIGARAGIIKDVESGKTMLGEPAREALRTGKIVAIIEKLPEIYKKFIKYEKMMDDAGQ
ncbi:MAG: UDP-3-O-(3-hydroxymyristoyl)glucosamine N-acyltransferase [Candidatus Omnitrophica bacterium]|nr:UDP-3-O-(3-hydroxymyristoyl)glucosamine N-acyltransferase [Candidatus Omnitrophota bacterium]